MGPRTPQARDFCCASRQSMPCGCAPAGSELAEQIEAVLWKCLSERSRCPCRCERSLWGNLLAWQTSCHLDKQRPKPRPKRVNQRHATSSHLRLYCEQSDAKQRPKGESPSQPKLTAWSRPCPDQAGSAASVSVQRFLPTPRRQLCRVLRHLSL